MRCSSGRAHRGARISRSPGVTRADRIHIGIDWLESVAFEHIDSIGERVLIIGVGNTAMDCCRTSRRLGGKDLRSWRGGRAAYFKASALGARRRGGRRHRYRDQPRPKRFVIEKGKLVGMEFEQLEWDAEAKKSRVIDTWSFPPTT